MSEMTREELMAIHDLLSQELETAQQQNDDEKIVICAKKYLEFVAAHYHRLGVSKEEAEEAMQDVASYDESHRKSEEAQQALGYSTQQMLESAREFGKKLWHHMRRMNSAPPHIQLTPDYAKSYRQFNEFWREYEAAMDKFESRHMIEHLQMRLDFYKQMLTNKDKFALPKSKLDLLEAALDGLRVTYEAEGETGEYNSLTSYELKRVRELFNKIDRSAASPPSVGGGH